MRESLPVSAAVYMISQLKCSKACHACCLAHLLAQVSLHRAEAQHSLETAPSRDVIKQDIPRLAQQLFTCKTYKVPPAKAAHLLSLRKTWPR